LYLILKIKKFNGKNLIKTKDGKVYKILAAEEKENSVGFLVQLTYQEWRQERLSEARRVD